MRNLMTSLRLLVARLGAWDAQCDRPWQRMEDEYVQALQYTPRPSPSLEVVHTLSLHTPRSLSPLPHIHSVLPSCLLDCYNLPLVMSNSVGATNHPGSISENASAADGQVPGSSGSIFSPLGNTAHIGDQIEVCVFLSKVTTYSTMTHHIGLE